MAVHWGIWDAWAKVERITTSRRVLRAKDMDDAGPPRAWLRRFTWRLPRVGPGLYALRDDEVDWLLLVATKYPRLTLGAASALWLHGILTHRPAADWWVMGARDRKPAFQPGSTTFLRSTHHRLDRTTATFEGIPIPVHTPIRATLDCIRHRKLLGAGATLEALHFALKTVPADALLERAAELHISRPLRAALANLHSNPLPW